MPSRQTQRPDIRDLQKQSAIQSTPRIISSRDPVDYEHACLQMREWQMHGSEHIWFLEHPSIFTIGQSGSASDIFDSSIPVYKASRGGKVIYHGPGQLVVYCVTNLARYNKDISAFIFSLEDWVLRALSEFGVRGHRYNNRGVWVDQKKIAFIGVCVHKWMTAHGIAFNYAPDLSCFSKILPCGIAQDITSLKQLGIHCTRQDVEHALIKTH